MKSNIIYYVVLLFLLIPLPGADAQNNVDYRKCMSLDSEKLLGMAREYEDRQSMDSALVLYSIVCNRSEQADEDEEIRRCCLAYIQKAFINISYYFNYTEAYDNILNAVKLRNKAGIEYTFVDNTMAMFYHVIAVTCRDWNAERKALESCRRAYFVTEKQGDRKNMDVFVANITTISCNLDDPSVLDEVWKTYRNDKDTTYAYRFNEYFYNYLKYRHDKEYDKSIEEAEKMLAMSLPCSDTRRIMMSYTSIVESSEKKGDYITALKFIEKEEKLVKKWNMRESIIEILDTKVKLYKNLGKDKLADSCFHQYLLRKDSLLNINQMSSICRNIYNGESRDMEKKIKEMGIENTLYNRIILIVSIFAIILVAMVFMLYSKIKQLKKSNITIYENNQANFKNDEKERQKLKSEVMKLENTSDTVVTKDEDVTVETESEIGNDEKYRNNSLSEDEKKKLLDKILTVMENVDEICSESFSGARLAELTGARYNYVSQVINENYGCNFNNFLNKFRIKEACRRLADDENYGNYTIDTISNSLGFKSRTTLTTSFKKIVGLTPSQYRNIAKEKKLEQIHTLSK